MYGLKKKSVSVKEACVTCSQSLAAQIGIDILKKGGNAADAAIATAMAVGVLEPYLSGIGGDCNILYYNAADKSIHSINGTGFNGKHATLESVIEAGFNKSNLGQYSNHGLFVTVPGAIAGISECLNRFSSQKITIKELLDPVIQLAEGGAVVNQKTACCWSLFSHRIKNVRNNRDFLLDGDRSPSVGEHMFAVKLAECLKILETDGWKAFYEGDIASRICEAVERAGGCLITEDFKAFWNSFQDLSITSPPQHIDFHGYTFWEMEPSTQGIVALVALNILRDIDLTGMDHNSSDYIHTVSEAIRMAFFDSWKFLYDPQMSDIDYKHLLSEDYASKCRKIIKLHCVQRTSVRTEEPVKAMMPSNGDTSYVAVVDPDGNACSFIWSISSGFGSGIIPDDCGFVIHDRGKCFSLDSESPNVYGPRKRPLHSIIPALLTNEKTGQLAAVLGVVGRWMQPQGHVQILLNMIVFGMDPEEAISSPRFRVGDTGVLTDFLDTCQVVYLEPGIATTVADSLRSKGHIVEYVATEAANFGRGQVIAKPSVWSKSAKSGNCGGQWSAACDTRGDGEPRAF